MVSPSLDDVYSYAHTIDSMQSMTDLYAGSCVSRLGTCQPQRAALSQEISSRNLHMACIPDYFANWGFCDDRTDYFGVQIAWDPGPGLLSHS